MVTYQTIKDYVKEKHGINIKSSWIAHAKEEYGVKVKKADNRKGERKWPCPKKRLPVIKEAFEHFKMI
tara:strand:- start:78 stop:281 length:204 start_codon:yes stop_codon:yes gene_type:complete